MRAQPPEAGSRGIGRIEEQRLPRMDGSSHDQREFN
jgi:hypothetical protein